MNRRRGSSVPRRGFGSRWACAGSSSTTARMTLSSKSCRNSLGDNVFDTHWAEGAALGPEDAVAYAQRGRGERKRPSSGGVVDARRTGRRSAGRGGIGQQGDRRAVVSSRRARCSRTSRASTPSSASPRDCSSPGRQPATRELPGVHLVLRRLQPLLYQAFPWRRRPTRTSVGTSARSAAVNGSRTNVAGSLRAQADG